MKIKRIRIKNFQSIKDLTLNFNESGVYYLNGDNNIGKSSIIKAINCLFFNASNLNYKDYIRDDEGFFSISMEDYDGNIVHLSRGTSDLYKWKINGESGVLNKTSGQVPIELKEYFNLYEDEKSKECANVRTPRAVLIGVDTSAGSNNLFLQKALNSSGFTKAYKQADADKRAKAKDLKVIETYINSTEEEVSSVNIEEVEDRLNKVERFESVLEQEKDMYISLLELNELLILENKLTIQIQNKSTVKQSHLNSIKNDIKELSNLEDLKIHKENIHNTQEKIDGLKLRGLKTIFKDINSLIGEFDLLVNLKNAKVNLQHLEDELATKDIGSVKADIDILDDDINLLGMLEKFKQSKDSYDKVNTRFELKNSELNELKQQIKDLKESLGVCPLCGNEFKDDKIHIHK